MEIEEIEVECPNCNENHSVVCMKIKKGEEITSANYFYDDELDLNISEVFKKDTIIYKCYNCGHHWKEEDLESKDILYKQIELEFEEALIEALLEYAKEKIVCDREELLNYGVNLVLKEITKEL